MVKKSKRKASGRRNVRRPRTRKHVCLLDLSDDLILTIFRKLGLADQLTAAKLRTVAPAFQFAASCTRLYNLFMRHIVAIEPTDDSLLFPPFMSHPAQSPPHIAWLLRNTPKVQKLLLPDTCAHLLADLPRNVPIEDIKICDISNAECTIPAALPRTLKKLCVYHPSSASIGYLASLHDHRQGFQLRKLSLCNVDIQYASQLRKFFSRSASHIKNVLLTFRLSLESEQRTSDNKVALEFIRKTCDTSHTDMPHLNSLAFAVHKASRLDGDWGHSHLPAFVTPVDDARAQNQRRLANSSLQMLFAYTDAELMESWVDAIGGAVAPTTLVTLEAGLNMISVVPPFLRSVPEMNSGLVVMRTRMTTLLNKQFPNIDTIRSSVMLGKLETLTVTERMVVDQWFYSTDEHREMMRTYIGLPSKVENLHLTFAFGSFSERAAFYGEEGNFDLLPILTANHEEKPEYVAFSFLNEIVSNVKMLTSLEVSFEVVKYAATYRSMVEVLMGALPELTELKLIMPVPGRNQNPIDAGLVDMTDDFVRGLPIFIYILGEACPKLEKVVVQNLTSQTGCDKSVDLAGILDEAFVALDWLEQKRPEVDAEAMRTSLEPWCLLLHSYESSGEDACD